MNETTNALTPDTLRNPQNCRKHGGWRSQFGKPSGRFGAWIGRLMAKKNLYMQELTDESLNVRPDSRILEIGFGPGVLIEKLARCATSGLVAGIDHSNVMVRLATSRNAKAIAAVRVDLREASAESLPFDDDAFDIAVAVNSLHITPNLPQALREARRVLTPGGLLFLPLRMAHPARKKFVAPGYTQETLQKTYDALAAAGFSIEKTELHHLARDVTCVWARAAG